VDGSGNGYLKTFCDYVHLNPARAKLLLPRQKLSAFRWSSYPAYLQGQPGRHCWLRVDRLLGEHGIPKDSAAGRREFERRLERRRTAEDGDEFAPLTRGWCVGSEAFRQELLAQVGERAGAEHFGAEIHESAEAKAQRIIRMELKALGWPDSELSRRRKGDPGKLRVALRLRQETTMTLEWIAQRLQMGTKTHLSHLLYWQDRDQTRNGEKVHDTKN
jgi:hypothetical protein